MRLKQLEIKGFKSFADKTVINLDNQITGIVGPNGCGKSNIVDAIRWVIGEHKIKQLRSDNLEDLVFNGSKSRNASGMAEVSLTFENTRNLLPTEFNIVTISRKFYKNGESEYRLNDVACRLKDITNLFLDTGVTSDSYSIIELGMVDDIIKDKEGSRRRMLEQAAGISIYRTRKKEAKQKLDATELDLNRIEDLLFEIANNLRTLESQAKKAEKYLQIKNEYKTVSVELVKASLQEFNTTYQTLNKQQQEEVDKVIALEAHIATEDAAVQKSKVELIAQEATLQIMQKAFNELVSNLLKLESDKSLSAQRIQHLHQLKTNSENFLKEATNQTQELSTSIANSEEKIKLETQSLTHLQEKLIVLRNTLDEKRANYDAQKSSLDQARMMLSQLQFKYFESEKKVAVADNTIANINTTLTQLQHEKENRTSEIHTLKLRAEEHNAQNQDQKKTLHSLETKRNEATAKILNTQEELEKLRVELVNENRKLDAKQNEHSLLKSLVDSLEGYPDSIKFLNNNADWNVQAPLLSDIMNVKDEYRICIENYLENYLNYYVVQNANEAYQAIQLLDTKKKGKAGFFIINELDNKKTNEAALPNTIAAINCVQVKAPYKTLIENVLQNVYIATTDAEVIQSNGNTTIIAQSGKVVRKQKTLNGGAVGLFEGNKIGRVQRLEKLGEEINELQKTCTYLRNAINETQTLIVGFNAELNEDRIKIVGKEINDLQNQIIQIEGKVENFEHLITQSETRKEQLQAQLQATTQGIATTKKDFDELKENLQNKQTQIAEDEKIFKITEGEYNKASEEYNQHNVVITRQQGRLSELNNEIVIRKNQLEDVKTKVESNKKQLETTSLESTQTQEQLKAIETNLLQAMQQKSEDEKVLNLTDQAFYVSRSLLAEQETALHAKQKEKNAIENVLNEIKEKLTDMKLQLSGMKERLQLEFRVNIDEVLKDERTTDTKVEDLQADVDKLKKRIENLGEVNPMAVEAYKETKGRHDFIQEQKADLVNAKESLLKTIEEVETTANQKFLDTFNQVRDNFVRVFQALFTEEDHCELKLVDPENPADTLIEIYAQPKGKRPSTLTQLSGGEKTLTSTAFLFAIYLIKPAPFCVLDEVDAPLDDANVLKFTQMIRRFSDNSQFIIVTHNKQTMASVDVIYGVTMQEAGVSKLVPVDFRSLN